MNDELDYLAIRKRQEEKLRNYTDQDWAKAICVGWARHDDLKYEKVLREWKTLTATIRAKNFLFL